MSSSYSAAELEAMRRQRLREELNRNIEKISNQLREHHENTVTRQRGSSEVISIVITDDIGDGTLGVSSVSAVTLEQCDKVVEQRDELDLSDLLIMIPKVTALEIELNSWVKKIDERVVVTEEDNKARQRILAEINFIVGDDSIDIEDKIKMAKMKVTSYLDSGIELTAGELATIDAEYYEYCALCGMLSVTAREHLPYKVKAEIARMRAVLEKRRESEYIMDVIEGIMEELGCHVREDAVLDQVLGTVFEVDGHPSCDVFVADDGSGIMFEPVGSAREVDATRKQQMEQSVKHVCSLYEEIEQRAAEQGVILKRVYHDEPNADVMCVQTDITEHKKERRKRRGTATKLKARSSED